MQKFLSNVENITGGYYGIVLETKDMKEPLRLCLGKMTMGS